MFSTPWHPVKRNNIWMFPNNISDPKEYNIDKVYNLCLDDYHIVIVNGEYMVTLGHSFIGPVISHDYFGSDKIINDLSKIDGWQKGLVHIKEVIRSEDELVIKLL